MSVVLVTLALGCQETAAEAPRPANTTRWLRVARGVTPVAVIEAKAGRPVTLAWIAPGDAGAEVEALWPELGRADGFHEEMHLGGKPGERGPLATVHFPPGHRDYLAVVASKVSGVGLNVDEIGPLGAARVAGPVRSLRVSHDGERVGRISFGRTGATLALDETESSAARILKIYLDQLAAMDSLHVWYADGSGAARALVAREARPGEAGFGDVVRLWLLGARRGDAAYFVVHAMTE